VRLRWYWTSMARERDRQPCAHVAGRRAGERL
ncbi:uncharacterized protein METZ01_LOCUS295254, partial [marine metagenome]